MYAPGITIAEYKTLCTPVCGQVLPSKLPPGQAPFPVKRNYDFYDEGGEKRMGCVICGTPFGLFKEGEKHFATCVGRNGNPGGYHLMGCQWFDCEEFLAHREKAGKGTQLTRGRPEAEKEGPVRKGRGTRISNPFEQYIINSKQQTLFIWPLDSSPDLLFAIWLDACEWSFDRIGKSRKETVRDMGIAQKGGYWDTGACGLSSSLTEGSV
ncbi:MAG: hypothetical protein LQ346_009081 [Caloplaca aetnensis]|nr:MAG: hypothetical protein LQ346_009081 [Caloplaca aetnensis]